jgi:tetratricopeptide (TPR) repeat protein
MPLPSIDEIDSVSSAWSNLLSGTRSLLSANQLEQAEYIALACLEYAESLRPHDRRLAVSLEILAEIHFKRKQYAQCAPVIARLYELYRDISGTSHPDTAKVANNAALLYQAWGKVKDAERCYLIAVKLKKAAFGTNHPEVTNLLQEYAGFLKQTGRLKESQAVFDGISELKSQAYGKTEQFDAINSEGLSSSRLQNS